MKFVTLGKACRILGKSKSTLKRWRKDKKIDVVVMDDGTYLYGVHSDTDPSDDGLWDFKFEDEDTQEIKIPEELHEKLRASRPAASPPVTSPVESSTVKKSISIYDAHVPFHDKATWRACLQLIRDEKPDEVILVGDFLDVSSMSSHAPGGWEISKLSEEIEAGKNALRELRDASADASIIYLEGNHESRPQRLAQQRLSQIVDLVKLNELLGLDELGIKWLPEGRALKRGNLRFVHGYWTNDHHAKTHLVRLLWPGVIYGHTHRPQMYSFADGDGSVRVAYGMPCMCELNPEWMRGQPNGWVNGFGVTYVDEATGQFNVYPVLSFNGRFVWAGKVYDGNRI